MLRKFCPKCAKETDVLFEGLCKDCYLKGAKFVEAPQNMTVLVCRCGRSNEKKKWVQNVSIEEMIDRIVISGVKNDKDTDVRVEYEPFEVNGKTKVPVCVVARKIVGGREIEKSAHVVFTIIPQTCDVCSRVSGGYYEAIIQIRGAKYKQNQVLELVERIVGQYKDTDKF